MRGAIRELLERDIRGISEWLGAEILELNVQDDHVHVVVSIPPKVSVSEYMGTVKGRTAIKLMKSYPGLRQKPYRGNHFWARGCFVSTIGLDEQVIRRYVRYQEKEEKREEKQQISFRLF
jgi:putative transposase